MNDKTVKSVFLIPVVLVLLGLAVHHSSIAQTPVVISSAIYVKQSGGEITFYTDQSSQPVLVISDSYCYGVSESARYVAVSETENPSSLWLYRLNDGTLLHQIPWQPSWAVSCGFIWVQDMLSLRITDGTRSILPLVVDINIITGIFSESYTIAPFSVTNLGDPFDFLPNLAPGSFFLQSPGTDMFLYIRCTTDKRRPGVRGVDQCDASEETVIYDVSTRQTIENLELAISGFTAVSSYEFDHSFAWSPSGRYLFFTPSRNYASRMIYDVENDTYRTLSINQPNLPLYLYETSVKWSPDETQVALWYSDSGFPNGFPVAFYDVMEDSLFIVPSGYPTLELSTPHIWGWKTDSSGIIFRLENGDLMEVALDGTETQLASNVIAVYYYAGVNTPTLPVPSPTPTNQATSIPTETPTSTATPIAQPTSTDTLTPTYTATATVSTTCPGLLREAESATLAGNFTAVSNASASGGQYIRPLPSIF